MGRRSRLAASALALILAGGPAFSAGLTPPSMPAATTANNGDLFMIWPVASSGPINQIAWSVLKAQMATALGTSYLQTTNNLSDIPSFATARTNLGLGGAALLNVGTIAGTVAAGNDTRITGALQASNNLSDIGTAATARTNLGVTATGADTTYSFRSNNLSDLASAATARTNLGVTATGADATYAARASNLSDLASASTARTNLGLGTAATQATSAFLQPSNNLSDVTTVATARNNILPTQTSNSGKFLTTDGTNASWGAVSQLVTAYGTIIGTGVGCTVGTGALNIASCARVSAGAYTVTFSATYANVNYAPLLTSYGGANGALAQVVAVTGNTTTNVSVQVCGAVTNTPSCTGSDGTFVLAVLGS